jgi:hypothetical protein
MPPRGLFSHEIIAAPSPSSDWLPAVYLFRHRGIKAIACPLKSTNSLSTRSQRYALELTVERYTLYAVAAATHLDNIAVEKYKPLYRVAVAVKDII